MRAAELHGVEVEGVTRQAFILRGALAAGALYGVGAVGPYVSSALAETAPNDVKILNFALTLENLEAAFYKAALAPAVGLAGEVRALATEFGAHEVEHANALSQLITQLGDKPDPAPKVKFPLSDQASFVKLAVALEETGIGAYNGAATLLQSPDLISAAGTIVQVEARHAAAFRMLSGQDPAPDAFDKPLAPPEVLTRIQPFVQS
jgi:rubrerythrin